MRQLFWSVRSAVFVLWLIVTLIPWAVLSLLASIVMRGTPLYWFTTFWLRFAIHGARVICGVRWRILGRDNLDAADRGGPMIVLPKHQSTWETFAFPQLMPHPLCYVFKRELLMIPFFGWAMARLDMVHIDRSKRAEAWSKVAEQGQRFMAQGNWVIMFPEGTRTPVGSQGRYKSGGARLAIATQAPVVPIAMNSGERWPKHAFIKTPGLVTISIGKLMPVAGKMPHQLNDEVEAWIEGEMRNISPDAYLSPSKGTA